MPYLTPDEIPEDDICRPLLIPHSTAWLAIVSGALTELTKAWNWEQEGDVTVEEAIERMQAMVDAYYDDECAASGGAPGFRLNIGFGGHWQQSDDGGETWHEPDGDYTVPPRVPREEPTEEERRCAAAANAAAVLAEVYEQMIDYYNTDTSLEFGEAVFVAMLAGLIGVWLGLIAAAAVGLAWAVFAQSWQILEILTPDSWTVDYNDKMKCLLYKHAIDVSDVVSFDYDAFITELGEGLFSSDINEGRLTTQLLFMLNFIGADGLNVAGQTTGVTDANCDDCAEQCELSLGGNGQDGWVAELPPGSACDTGDLAYDGTLDRIVRTEGCTASGGTGGYVIVGASKEINFNIARIAMNYDLVNSSCQPTASFMRVWDDVGTQVAVSSSGTILGGTGRVVNFIFDSPLPAGEYYITLECGNATSSVPGGAYAAINAIQVCGSI